MHFKNRTEAGKQLGQLLRNYRNMEGVVYALPRGGVVVAAEIAVALNFPLDLIFAHKIGHPYQPEYAIAAVSESGYLIGGAPYELKSIEEAWLEREKKWQMEEIKRKRELYLKGKKQPELKNKIAILVDDGIATGLTMRAGIKELKMRQPHKIIVAVPVASKDAADLLKAVVDEFVGIEVAEEHKFLGSVGAYYDEFNQVGDEEVIRFLEEKRC
jgi:putative phosphoribosyl transferase